MMASLSFVFLVVFTVVIASDVEKKKTLLDVEGGDQVEDDEHWKGDNEVFLLPRTAKSVLRVRRWGIKSVWGEEQEEESESRERRNEANRRAEHQRVCQASCWGGWGGFSGCSVPCGTDGKKKRTRAPAPSANCAAIIAQKGCPGVREQKVDCGRSCYNGGTLRRTDCRCPAGYTGRCCVNRVTCSFPGRPTNGVVTLSGNSHRYGVVARYSCATGYNLQGPTTRTCQSNAKWSGTLPSCRIQNCGNPGVLAHGSVQGSNFQYGKSLVYTCQTGYRLSGHATLVCAANGKWNYAKPVCQIVECPAAQTPANGTVIAPSKSYQSVATFRCKPGFEMQGSVKRTCQANGQWNGAQPSCSQILCDGLPPPAHGGVRPPSYGKVVYGTMARFSCLTGYRLQGPKMRVCIGSRIAGSWSGTQTVCIPVDCSNPGVPANGVKQGGTYTFKNKVQFKCQPGYKLSGSNEITCTSSGSWSGSRPSCAACSPHTYKIGLSSATVCSNCPSNSHTVTSASSRKDNCICNKGFRGQPGGPCQEILCPNLPPPLNARAATCNRKINSVCKISCNDGYIVSSGNEFRKCLPGGSWAGSDLACTACPINDYKANNSTCSRCPDHSSTSNVGNSLSGCRCDAGFSGSAGGPCKDADECIQNPGCQQSCVNTVGSYRCACTIPGYLQDASNSKACLLKNSCPDFDAPDNGGVTCVQEVRTNIARCQVKCNPGYEHPLQPNVFEECGPNTGWTWSTQLDEALTACTQALFEGVALELEVAYFIEDCNSLTAAQKKEISKAFLSILRSNGVCLSNGKASCDLGDTSVRCGTETDDDFGFFDDWDFRRKRSVRSGVLLKFVLKTPEASTTSCATTCGNDVSEACQNKCERTTMQHANQTVLSAAAKVQDIFSNTRILPSPGLSERPSGTPAVPTISVSGRTLVPMKGLRRHQLQMRCPAGMMKHVNSHTCVECPPGTHSSPNSSACILCPMGTHQPNARQTTCIPCVMRPTTITKSGATSCDQVIRLVIRPGGFRGRAVP